MASLEYIARTVKYCSQRQLLREHLKNVASIAQRFSEEVSPNNILLERAAYLAGLLHDLGKYRLEFQELIAGQRARDTESAHAVYGAAAGCLRFESLMHGFAIAGHHAGLHDTSSLSTLVQGGKFKAQERFPELIKTATQPNELPQNCWICWEKCVKKKQIIAYMTIFIFCEM
ncbi:MAG: CRISPR-associated endonuclease Cas3'' [Thermoguttaceae bacterium]